MGKPVNTDYTFGQKSGIFVMLETFFVMLKTNKKAELPKAAAGGTKRRGKLELHSPEQIKKAGGSAAYLKKIGYKVPETLSLGEEFSREEKLDILNYEY